MYRVLIVDDERIARESVRGLLSLQDDLDLELVMAESALKAVSVLENELIDLVIMDINMPQMTGLELYEIVRKNWPSCKVIFLTGYSEFDYVYKVHKHARYVLKAEREEVLLEAVRESIREIEHDMLVEQASDLYPEIRRRMRFHIASDFMNELVEGYVDLGEVTSELLQKKEIPLDPKKTTFSMWIRYEDLRDQTYSAKETVREQMPVLLERYYGREGAVSISEHKRTSFFLLFQPDPPFVEDAVTRRLLNISSLFLNALQLNFGIAASILILEKGIRFSQALRSFGLLSIRIGSVEPGDIKLLPYSDGQPVSSLDMSDSGKIRILRDSQKLDQAFEESNVSEIIALLRQIRNISSGLDRNNMYVQEVYYRVVTELLKKVKAFDLDEQTDLQSGLKGVYNIQTFSSWDQAFEYLAQMTEMIFERYEQARTEKQEDLVSRIKHHIQRNLDQDISVTSIAENYHFSREYIMRLFKKEEGITILQYINDLKEQRAKELLQNPELPVKDIAVMLGFNGTGQFIRFFKAKTGLSPQAFREKRRS